MGVGDVARVHLNLSHPLNFAMFNELYCSLAGNLGVAPCKWSQNALRKSFPVGGNWTTNDCHSNLNNSTMNVNFVSTTCCCKIKQATYKPTMNPRTHIHQTCHYENTHILHSHPIAAQEYTTGAAVSALPIILFLALDSVSQLN